MSAVDPAKKIDSGAEISAIELELLPYTITDNPTRIANSPSPIENVPVEQSESRRFQLYELRELPQSALLRARKGKKRKGTPSSSFIYASSINSTDSYHNSSSSSTRDSTVGCNEVTRPRAAAKKQQASQLCREPPSPAVTPPSQPPRNIRRGAAPPPPPPSGGPLPGITMKRMIWTGAFAAVAIVGAIYGAGLKTQQEYKAEKKQIIEASVEDRIRGLEEHRASLARQKLALEEKLAVVRLRIQQQQQQHQEGLKKDAEKR
ncbi:hypothetical protein F4779DRAFT_614982 [Xylariaceae sp. FL0662B]|nr:hypothetical protein F4779DRAFT_614982 [Xylariaceae sp. FL0662B]